MGWRINSKIVLPVSGLAFPRGRDLVRVVGTTGVSLDLVWFGLAVVRVRLRLERSRLMGMSGEVGTSKRRGVRMAGR